MNQCLPLKLRFLLFTPLLLLADPSSVSGQGTCLTVRAKTIKDCWLQLGEDKECFAVVQEVTSVYHTQDGDIRNSWTFIGPYDPPVENSSTCSCEDALRAVPEFTCACNPEAEWEEYYDACNDELRDQMSAARQRYREEQYALEDQALSRFVSLKVLLMGTAKGAAKLWVYAKYVTTEVGKVAFKWSLGAAAVGWFASEGALAYQEWQDADDKRAAVEEADRQMAAHAERCMAIMNQIEACGPEHDKWHEDERRRLREEEEMERRRELARERVGFDSQLGMVYRDINGHVYRGDLALRAAMRDLEQELGSADSEIQQTASPIESAASHAGSTQRAMISHFANLLLNREPTEEEVDELEGALIAAAADPSIPLDPDVPVAWLLASAGDHFDLAGQVLSDLVEDRPYP
jgi:hypothetical protein